MEFQDYYSTLGVDRSADAERIKTAYRQLALKWHPDRHPAGGREEAEEEFKRINEAYEVLSDPEKRKRYDTFGENWRQGQEFGGDHEAVRMTPEEFERRFGSAGFSEFFESIFGDQYAKMFAGGGPAHERFSIRGADVRAEVALGVSEAIAGGKRRFAVPTITACQRCGGLGIIDKHMCPACAGVGTVRSSRTIDLTIPPDVSDGAILRLRGLGGAGMGGAPSGDLLVGIRLVSDHRHRIDGGELEADLPLAPWELVEGIKVQARTPAGLVMVNVAPGTKVGTRLRLKEKGLARKRSSRGDFYVVVRLGLPEELTVRQRELLRELGASGPSEVTGGVREANKA